MSIEEIIQRLRTAMDDAREHESHFESWLIQNEGICDAIDALKEIDKSQRQPLTDEMVLAAARMLNNRQAEACGVDRDDQWKFYSDDFKADARAMLEAAHGIKE